MIDTIESFSGEYRFLSNFYPANIFYNGRYYQTTEHAYQAAKAKCITDIDAIGNSSTPFEAKRLGQVVEMREDWDYIKLKVMEDINRLKFNIPELKTKLLETNGFYLVEGNTWGDKFWGVCEGKGSNYLGKILMKIRDDLAL